MNLGKTTVFHQYEERLQLPYLEALEALKQGFKTLKGSSTLYPRSGCAAALEIFPHSKRDVPEASSSHSAVDFAPGPELPVCACTGMLCRNGRPLHLHKARSKPAVDGYKIIYKELINAASVLLHNHVAFALQASANGAWLSSEGHRDSSWAIYGQAANFREGQKGGMRKLP